MPTLFQLTLDAVESNLPLILSALGLGVGVSFMLILYTILSTTSQEITPVQARLMALKGQTYQNKQQDNKLQELKAAITEAMGPVANALYGGNAKKEVDRISKMLAKAGLPDSELAVHRFMTQRLMSASMWAILGSFLSLVLPAEAKGLVSFLFCVMFGAVIGGMLPLMELRGKGAKRSKEMVRSLPDVLDLMVVCVEAGLGLDSTIQRIAKEAELIAPHMCVEFNRIAREMNAGLTRTEVFQGFSNRCDIEELRSLTTLVIQSEKLGTSIAESLRIYSDDMRLRRKQKAEELAAKASIKMIFPLVLFVFPPLLIILLGPMVVQALQSFGIV